jgi:alpha-tubulin suppressor-like RCC1 family protein
MDKISIINEYNLLKSYQKSNSSTINRAFDVIYYSIINPEFLILKNNKYYKYSNSSFEEIQTDKIIPSTSSISYNNYNIFYIKNNGETYTIINDDNLTYKILSLKNAIRLTGNLSKKYIVKVSCGDSHALFLTHAGMLFSIGDNNLGQLGLGENEKIKETGEAIMIKELLNYRIIDISTGNNHCLAFGVVRDLTKVNNKDNSNNKNENKDNITFTWGDNSFGQCGIKDNKITFINSPNKILINDNEIINDGVKSIFCGLNFSVLLLNNGKIFGFGDNQFHQLDLNNDVKKLYHPQELIIDYINNKKAKVVNLIVSSFSVGLITDGKFIYILGKYSGLGNEGKIIELENNIDKGIKVVLTDDKIFFFII